MAENGFSNSYQEKVKNCLREPAEVMHFQCLGAFHSSYISFSRSLVRKMIREKWKITQQQFNLDKNGYGNAVYRIETPTEHYHAVFFTQYLNPELRTDRVIATAWDMSCALWRGNLEEKDIEFLGRNLPKQEHGRYNGNVLSISRVNKSVRLFDYTVDRLSKGMQPDVAELKKTGYLVRTTAVYGNGKFGMADYNQLLNSDFSCHFHAQMLMVYMVRQFTLDWIECLAQFRNPDYAVKLLPAIAQFFGTGNSTGLGMGPFLIKHPHVINSWIKQREQLLQEIIYKASLSDEKKEAISLWILKGIEYFSEVCTADAIQAQKNKKLTESLRKMQRYLEEEAVNSLEEIYTHIKAEKSFYSNEMVELFFSILMETHPEISRKYDVFSYVPEGCSCVGDKSLSDILGIIERDFNWATSIDYKNPENIHFFWYQSEDKEEPRLGERFVEPGEERESRVDIGRSVSNLYDTLNIFMQSNEDATVADFLLCYPNYSAEIRRLINYKNHPYGEIRENILSKNMYAIDILRAKLAFFGAVKFDPKSDRWLRITLFQGAPLLTDEALVDEDDNWFLYRYEDKA